MDIPWKDQYKHPEWQKKRLKALEAANFTCQCCDDRESQLQVHHKRYIKGRKVWDYDLSLLTVLCDNCHENAHIDKSLLLESIDLIPEGRLTEAASLLAGYFYHMHETEDMSDKVYEVGSPYCFEVGVLARALSCSMNLSEITNLRDEVVGKKKA